MFLKETDIFNKELDEYLNDFELNYGRLILPSQDGELSVMGVYSPEAFHERYITLNQSLEPIFCEDFKSFYYGVSPNLDSELIINAISGLELKNEESLNKFISAHSSLFMLHDGQQDYIAAIAKYIVIAVAMNYGIILEFDDETTVNAIIESSSLNALQYKKDTTNKKRLTVCGCPTDSLLKTLEKYQYDHIEKNIFQAVPCDEQGASIFDIYSNPHNLELISSNNTFYSGVLLKPMKIEEKESWHTNKDIVSLCIYYERSTYATVFAFDNNFTDHPLLLNDKESLEKFFSKDDSCKITHLKAPVEKGQFGRADFIKRVNDYLKESYNVNQICVSGNIVTSDQILVYTQRASKTIDSGKIYPGVNGNAEIADQNVSFYKFSADADLPTIILDGLSRRFSTELCRETAAELNLSVNNN